MLDNNDNIDASLSLGENDTPETAKNCLYFPEFGDNKSVPKSYFSMLLECLDVLVSAIIAVIILFVFVFKVPTIDGDSMNDTLFNGERVVISNMFYEPEYGDIVVISRNYTNNNDNIERYSMPIIKRIIATEGQTVDIDFEKGIVYVDGKALSEDYTKTPTNLAYDIKFPVTVKENCVFVMGDNRNDSLDSRSSSIGDDGMIDKRYILGKALFRVFPLNRIGKLY